MFQKALGVSVVACLTLLLVACGGSGGSSSPTDPGGAPLYVSGPSLALPGAQVIFTASGGSDPISWTAPGGNPGTGSGREFATVFGSPSTYQVTATDGRGLSASTSIEVPADSSVSLDLASANIPCGGTVPANQMHRLTAHYINASPEAAYITIDYNNPSGLPIAGGSGGVYVLAMSVGTQQVTANFSSDGYGRTSTTVKVTLRTDTALFASQVYSCELTWQ